MVGVIDCGGGMRGVYTSGIYDYFLDNGIKFNYGIGVSAGAANMVSFLAGHKGRTLRFYRDYSFRKEYMSVSNYIKTGSYLNLDYIYTTLTNEGGEDPLNYSNFEKSNCEFYAVGTDGDSAKPYFFRREQIKRNNYEVLKATCALPLACKPQGIDGRFYFDGGLSLPIPYKKAFDDGCERLLILMTRPKDYVKLKQKNLPFFKHSLRKYPLIYELLKNVHILYNEEMEYVKSMEKDGRILIVAPNDTFGINTLKKDRTALIRLYEKGYMDGELATRFINM